MQKIADSAFCSKCYKRSRVKVKGSFKKLMCVLKKGKEKKGGVFFLFLFFYFLVPKSCQKWMRLCSTRLKQAKIRSEKFFAGRRKNGGWRKIGGELNELAQNGLKCLGFSIRSS